MIQFVVSIFAVFGGAILAWELYDKFVKPRLPEIQKNPIISTVEKDVKPVLTDIEQAKLSVLGSAITTQKTRADQAEQALAAKQAELDAANSHIAELMSQLANEKQNHADLTNAVAALADQQTA